MEKVYKRTGGLQPEIVGGFCPGCMHGCITKTVR